MISVILYFVYAICTICAKEAVIITKLELRERISKAIKILRAEYGYSQQEMANSIGLSKKTIIQVEKERLLLSWCATCAVCSVYNNSHRLYMELGEFPVSIIETLAHDNLASPTTTAPRAYIFWDVIEEDGDYILSKNIISEHYKVTDKEGKKYYSSFDYKKIIKHYTNLVNKGENK